MFDKDMGRRAFLIRAGKASLSATALGALLASCGNSANQGEGQGSGGQGAAGSNTPAPAQGAAGQAVTLRYGLWNKDQAPAMEDIVKEFKKTNPNIDVTVEVTPFDQYFTKLETAATGGALPDVFWMNGPNIIKYGSNKILLPLTERIKAGNVNLGDYPRPLTDLYTVDGIPYALPKDFDTIALWYNKELFDAAGTKYPDETWDWAALRDAAKKLTDKAKGVWGVAAALPLPDQEGYYNTILQNEGYVISEDKKTSGYDKPETIGGLKFWTDLIADGVAPTYAQAAETAPHTLFQSGKVAMLYGGSWRLASFSRNENIKNKIDVAPLPQGRRRAVVIHGLGNVIAASTKYPNEAWAFLKFLGGREAAEIQAKTGTVIPALNGAQELWAKSNPQMRLQVFLDAVGYAKPYPTSKETAKWKALETENFRQALSGQVGVEEAAKTVAAGMNQILAQEQR